MALYGNTYRVRSARLPHWDYRAAAWYFVTICTRDGRHFLGDVVEGEMRPSSAGRIVQQEWLKTGEQRPNVTLDAFIVMPNHVHGVIVLAGQSAETPRRSVSTPSRLQANSLGSIIGQFKGACTSLRDFGWQRRFYDHIIRNQQSLRKIREYIQNNPLKWELDKRQHREPVYVTQCVELRERRDASARRLKRLRDQEVDGGPTRPRLTSALSGSGSSESPWPRSRWSPRPRPRRQPSGRAA